MSTLPVIAAVDGSDDSLRALDLALDEARRREASLRVVHVRQYAAWARPDVLLAGAADADDDPVLDRVRTYLEDRPDRPRTEYRGVEGAPGAVLPELGSTAQLLVLGSRGRGGFASLLLGSNGMAAARDAECPVIVVPRPGREVEGEAPAGPGPRVVVGLHVDSPDDATLDFAFTEAALRGARLQVVAAEFHRIAVSHGVPQEQFYVFATEAMRRADNAADMLSAIADATNGIGVQILEPAVETLCGAVMGSRSGFVGVPGGALFLDLGGGSVQMTWVDTDVDGYETKAATTGTSMGYGAA
ncbi:universal stress protein, partial [Streptomyces pseudovenezuelae]|uniref:universal stress protein n=1 Tax=Streptomyces pseudovenezuelae TaxID=67350 RepID=UPI0034A14F6C